MRFVMSLAYSLSILFKHHLRYQLFQVYKYSVYKAILLQGNNSFEYCTVLHCVHFFF